jgi:hypothetical protein
MEFVCDVSGGRTWFRIETEAEAAEESRLMRHAVEKHFRRAREEASQSFNPAGVPYIEQDIRRATHIRRVTPAFLTLRDPEGVALVTAMLPSVKQNDLAFRPVIVGQGNSDPYPKHGDAIGALAKHFGITLDRMRCYPYHRTY